MHDSKNGKFKNEDFYRFKMRKFDFFPLEFKEKKFTADIKKVFHSIRYLLFYFPLFVQFFVGSFVNSFLFILFKCLFV